MIHGSHCFQRDPIMLWLNAPVIAGFACFLSPIAL
jgi:hypothetical protein